MTKVIEAYNYKIGLDVSGLQGGGIITRRELSQLRRDIWSLQDPVEKSAARLNRLNSALNKGGLDAGMHAEAVRRIKDAYPEVIAEKKRLADLEQQMSVIRRRQLSEDQLYRQEMDRVKTLVRETGLSHAEGARHLREYRESLPSAVAALRQKADAERQVQAIQRSLLTDQQRYEAELQRVTALVGTAGFDQQQLAEHMERYRATLPSVASAERERAAAMAAAGAIQRSLMTDQQLYQAELQRVTALVGTAGLTQAQATAHMERYRAALPSVASAERERAAAASAAGAIQRALMTDQQLYQAELQRVTALVGTAGLTQAQATAHMNRYRATLPGVIAAERARAAALTQAEAITRRNETATERYARQLRETNALHRTGTLGTVAYARELRRLNEERMRASVAGPAAAQAGGSGIPTMIGTLGRLSAAYATVATAKQVFDVSLGRETAQASLEAMAGSAERGKQLFEALQADAQKALIDPGQYQAAATTLLSLGNMATESVVPAMAQIGEIAQGNVQRMQALAYVIAQVNSLGNMNAGDRLQFINAGFNPLEEISRTTGRSMPDLAQDLSQGKITAEMVNEALRTATAEGGRYFGSLEKHAKTTTGALAELKAEVATFSNDLGSTFHDEIKTVAGGLAALVRGGAGLVDAIRPVATLPKLVETVDDAATAAWDGLAEFRAALRGMATDAYDVGAGLATLDGDRIGRGFNSDGMVASLQAVKVAREELAQATVAEAQAAEAAAAAEVQATAARARAEFAERMRQQQQAAQRERDADTRKEIAALRERNLILAQGVEYAQQYKLSRDGVSAEARAELAELQQRNKELENAAQIKERTVDLERQLQVARQAEAIRQQIPGLDAANAAQLAELHLLGMTADQLQDQLSIRRELLAIQQREKREQDQASKHEQLASEAERLRESLRSPLAGLAADYGKLQDMYQAGMLAADQYAAAKLRAAQALVQLPNQLSTTGANLGDGQGLYRTMVEEQNAQRKAQLERVEAARIQRSAEMLAGLEQRRLAATQVVTAQMREQAAMAQRIAQLQARSTHTPGLTTATPAGGNRDAAGDEHRHLERIAEASERAASSLSQWHLVGV